MNKGIFLQYSATTRAEEHNHMKTDPLSEDANNGTAQWSI